MDILLRRADLPAATTALEAAGFVHRRVACTRAGGRDGGLPRRPRWQGARCPAHRLRPEKTRPDQPEPKARIDQSEDVGDFRLITLDALVTMKLSAFRDKDRVHLRDLISVGLVDATWLPHLPETLRPRLQEILATPDE